MTSRFREKMQRISHQRLSKYCGKIIKVAVTSVELIENYPNFFCTTLLQKYRIKAPISHNIRASEPKIYKNLLF